MKWLVRPAKQGGESVTPLKTNKISQASWGRTDQKESNGYEMVPAGG